jgi:predicted alpha/beta superfamily hydrolase
MSAMSLAPVSVAGSATLDFVAHGNGQGYRLMMTPPIAPAPAGGYPVLWVLDGAGYNGLAVDMVRNRGALGGELDSALVVSVGYPTDDVAEWMSRRFGDFSAWPPGPGPFEQVPSGGLERFLDMLSQDALPAVAERFAIDPQRMAIVGHSMGGLAVLHALFTRPAMFQSFLAISPSIHWGGCAVLANEAAFAAQVRDGLVAPRVFIAVGGREQTPPAALPAGHPGPLEDLVAAVHAQRAVDHVAELADRLRALSGAPGYELRYSCPPDETHMSVPFVVFGAALDLAFGVAPSTGSR